MEAEKLKEDIKLNLERLKYWVWCWIAPMFWITYIILMAIIGVCLIIGISDLSDYMRGAWVWLTKLFN